jgi:Helix-turn-helix domain
VSAKFSRLGDDAVQVNFEADDLRPVIEVVVEQLVDRLVPDDRLAVSEAEAARLLGIAPHVLRDARRRGEVTAGKIGKTYVYLRSDLVTLVRTRKASGAR